MSKVFSMEAEGISKFWKIKVMTKRPIARTVHIEARDSRGVSVWSCWVVSGSFGAVSVLVKTGLHRCSYQCIADGWCVARWLLSDAELGQHEGVILVPLADVVVTPA